MTRRMIFILCVAVLISGFSVGPANATVLWDNGPLRTCKGCGADGADESVEQNNSLGMLGLGFVNSIASNSLMADDFTVEGGVWDLTRITVFAYQTSSPAASTINDLRYQIWDGSPDEPASNIVYGGLTNSLSGSDWTNIYRVNETISGSNLRPIMRIYSELEPGTLLLQPGTYWLVWQTGGSGALTGPWASPVTITGQTTTGDALGFFGGSWINIQDSGTGTPQGMPFVIEGSKVTNFNLSTGIVNIPVVTIDGSSKRYQVEMERTPGTLDFTVTDSSKIP